MYSKVPSQRDGSFEHPKQMFKQTDKKIFTILSPFFINILTYESFLANHHYGQTANLGLGAEGSVKDMTHTRVGQSVESFDIG